MIHSMKVKNAAKWCSRILAD